MSRNRSLRLASILLIGAIGVVFALSADGILEADSQPEYKFVRLTDDGAMPVISDALNREAERGWELEEMAVVAGETGTIYLVFKK